jgi:tetratricopeptide (TPR) repeat protein
VLRRLGLILAFVVGCAPPQAIRPTTTAEPSWEANARAFIAGEGGLERCDALLEAEAIDRVLRGDVALRCEREAEALASYEQAWRGGEQSCALTRMIADLRARSGDEDGALALLAEPHERCRALSLWTARFARERAPQLADEAIAHLLGLDSDDPEALAEQVRLEIARGHAGLTEATCARADALARAELHEACALAAQVNDEQHEAERHFRRAAELEPEARRFVNLGRFLSEQRRHADAASAFRAAIALAPDDYDAVVGLGLALTPHCSFAARDVFRHAQALAPERPEAWLHYGLIAAEVWCGPEEEAMASMHALERFVELARGREDLDAAVEDMTRRCPRDASRRRDRPGSPSAECRDGSMERLLANCSASHREMRQMQLAIESQAAAESADCSHPWPPPR